MLQEIQAGGGEGFQFFVAGGSTPDSRLEVELNHDNWRGNNKIKNGFSHSFQTLPDTILLEALAFA